MSKRIIGIGCDANTLTLIETIERHFVGFDFAGLLTIEDRVPERGSLPQWIIGVEESLPQLVQQGALYFFLATGPEIGTATRRRLFELAVSSGLTPCSVIHPKATVSPSATIGLGCTIFPGAIIGAKSMIGENVTLSMGAIVESDCIVAPHSYIGPHAVVSAGTQMEERIVPYFEFVKAAPLQTRSHKKAA